MRGVSTVILRLLGEFKRGTPESGGTMLMDGGGAVFTTAGREGGIPNWVEGEQGSIP